MVGVLWTFVYSIFGFVTSPFIYSQQKEIHSAILRRDINRVKKYLEQGGDINAVAAERMTGLHLAVKLKNYEIADFLLSRGAEVNVKDKYNVTPLHTAVTNKDSRLTNLLIDYGAVTDIFITTLQGNIEALQNYLQVGGNPNITTGKSRQTLLELSIKAHSLAMVKCLLDKGAEITKINARGFTPLYIAASEGQYSISKLLIDRGAKVNTICDRHTALYQAARSGNQNLVELLLNSGAKINIPTCHVLHKAVDKDNIEIVELLINRGAKINSRDGFPFRETPLHLAIKKGNINLVELLLSKGADANLKTFFPPMTAIQMATQYPEIVKLLKNYGATVDFAVFNAASKGDFEVIKEYINEGGNVNATYQQETTLLHFAASRGHNDIVQLLIDNGANVNAKNQQEVTPLLYAAQYATVSKNQSTAALLIVHGAIVDIQSAALLKNIDAVRGYLEQGGNPNAKIKGRMTLLQMAVMSGELEMVQLLLDKGVKIVPRKSFNLLVTALQRGHIEIFKLLVDYGAKVNSGFFFSQIIGFSLLNIAVTSGNIELVQLLIDNGANINKAGWFINSMTPLHLAAQLGYLEVAELLLNNGANVNAKTRFSGFTPLQLSRDLAIKILLKKYGAKG
ncbi:ankyrin repeat domain-containing protein [Hyella patelloides]|uniref:ankyrin repeat domain-containing protein n=1 Tax=Hyella patelloides TaxID=1982969 RepID=UPI001643F144|nr:ankyrin repeat domain-containing protein [Hyella patelloides]